jgi:hypothetical protein
MCLYTLLYSEKLHIFVVNFKSYPHKVKGALRKFLTLLNIFFK